MYTKVIIPKIQFINLILKIDSKVIENNKSPKFIIKKIEV